MNIFFTGSIRGGRALQPQYALIVEELKKYGEVHSQFVQDEKLSQYGETQLSDQEIFGREQLAVNESDIVIAEVTIPSLGVGHLISYASQLNKKIIALYYGEDTLKLSAMIKGDPHVEVYAYLTKDALEEICRKVCVVG